MDDHDQNMNVPVIDSATGLPVIDPETGEQTYINIKITAIDSQPSLANLESQCLVSDPVGDRAARPPRPRHNVLPHSQPGMPKPDTVSGDQRKGQSNIKHWVYKI